MTGTPDDQAAAIMAATAEFFKLSIADLCGRGKAKALVAGRHIAMYLCRELTDLTLPQIGDAFGGRDHTTVLHAHRKIRAAINDDHDLRERVRRLSAHITGSGICSTKPDTTTASIRRAQLVVAGASRDPQDCQTLLEMLGLLPYAAAKRRSPAASGSARTEGARPWRLTNGPRAVSPTW